MGILGFLKRKENAELAKFKEDAQLIIDVRESAKREQDPKKRKEAFHRLATIARDSRYHRIARLLLHGAVDDPKNWDHYKIDYAFWLERSLKGDDQARKEVGKIDLDARRTLTQLASRLENESHKISLKSPIQQLGEQLERDRKDARFYLEAAKKIRDQLESTRSAREAAKFAGQLRTLVDSPELPLVTRLEMLMPESPLIRQWTDNVRLMVFGNDTQANLKRIEAGMRYELSRKVQKKVA